MTGSVEVTLPDIGDYKDVPVVEINVAVGDRVQIDMPLLSIESDKATMEVPSPAAGTISKLMVEIGSRVSQGTLLMILDGSEEDRSGAAPVSASELRKLKDDLSATIATTGARLEEFEPVEKPNDRRVTGAVEPHASPSVRSLSRELGVSLDGVTPSGLKGRVLRDDVINYVKQVMGEGRKESPVTDGVALDWPMANFEKFGTIERMPLSRIQKLTGANLLRNWRMIPHVTNFDKADVTELETFRKIVNDEAEQGSVKLTMVSMLIKAASGALKKYPRFNSSLGRDELILKQYVHIGFAVDTPNGLVVPVIRDCDRRSLLEIASEMRRLADKATKGQLAAEDMQGGCFSVSSLGGVGGHGFTPIINAPEVAILGAGKASTEAVWDGREFRPRLVLPISLSWDHRVVDGVAATRFLAFIASSLSDLRRCVL
jgi:pyruvate dehydrogenase E2 component (dihydrolipoamide acetyltransferase)